MKRLNRKTLLYLAPVCLLMLLPVYFSPADTCAGEEKNKAIEYNLEHTFEDNLRMYIGRRVNVTLATGQSMSGKVKDVKNGLLHLEKISSRNYFDALIKIKNISAMDARFRGF